ncbi:hypothetical protein C8R43DRAFT_976335 [Mycena crocata]|nr:hypothetical protein C8R43DRAFT_976335 [Mycena crocata]
MTAGTLLISCEQALICTKIEEILLFRRLLGQIDEQRGSDALITCAQIQIQCTPRAKRRHADPSLNGLTWIDDIDRQTAAFCSAARKIRPFVFWSASLSPMHWSHFVFSPFMAILCPPVVLYGCRPRAKTRTRHTTSESGCRQTMAETRWMPAS